MTQPPEETPAAPRRPPAGEFYVSWSGRDLIAVGLFAAAMVGVAMAWTWLPGALAMLAAGDGGEVTDGRRLQFLLAYGAMVAAPVVGWALWFYRRHVAAVSAILVLMAAVAVLGPAQGL